MKQWEKEKIEQILYDKDKNFLVRSRMIDFLKTVDVDEEKIEKVAIVEEAPKLPLESIVAPSGVFLSGNPKPQYPDYEGPPTI